MWLRKGVPRTKAQGRAVLSWRLVLEGGALAESESLPAVSAPPCQCATLSSVLRRVNPNGVQWASAGASLPDARGSSGFAEA